MGITNRSATDVTHRGETGGFMHLIPDGQLSRPEQTTSDWGLGSTGLKKNISWESYIFSHPHMCSCKEAYNWMQPFFLLQDCTELQSLREEMWPEPVTLHKKLYASVEALKRTAEFLLKSQLQVCRRIRRRKKEDCWTVVPSPRVLFHNCIQLSFLLSTPLPTHLHP